MVLCATVPPFGVAEKSFGCMIRAMLPFYLPFGAALLIITYWPGLVLWLPRLIDSF